MWLKRIPGWADNVVVFIITLLHVISLESWYPEIGSTYCDLPEGWSHHYTRPLKRCHAIKSCSKMVTLLWNLNIKNLQPSSNLISITCTDLYLLSGICTIICTFLVTTSHFVSMAFLKPFLIRKICTMTWILHYHLKVANFG